MQSRQGWLRERPRWGDPGTPVRDQQPQHPQAQWHHCGQNHHLKILMIGYDDWHQSDLPEHIKILTVATTQVKSMKNPAPIVKFVIESVCVMKGILPKRWPCNVAVLVVVVDVDHCSGQRDLKINLIYIRKPDLENKGKLVDDYWSPGQQVDPITLVLVPTLIVLVIRIIVIVILVPTLIVIFFVLLITIFIFIRCLETSSSWTHWGHTRKTTFLRK